MMMQPLQGSFVALVTPMFPGGSLDYASLQDLIEWQIKDGISGIVSVGTTGESATLNVKEHLEIIEKTIEYTNGRVPVIAGTGANSTQEAIELTQTANSLGADYALIVTPYYNKPNQDGLLKHYLKIANEVDIPQILYNVPSRTACDLQPETVLRLSDHPNIIGIKEAVDDEQRMDALLTISKKLKDKKNFSILSGDDPTFNSFMSKGADGVISVAANIIPGAISKICTFNLNKEFNKAIELNQKYSNLYDLLFVESNPIPVKWALEKMNKIESGIRLPLVSLDGAFNEEISKEMSKLELI
jgi:4-hydroxy-tetrahydrodipicolinate synthase